MIGCQQGNPPAPAADSVSPYVQELTHICNSEERSGALEYPEGQRSMVVAQWLGDNVQTEQGRAFLVRLAKTPPAEKAAVLQQEAAQSGLPSCPLARSWGG